MILHAVFSFLLGSVVGSFLNVVIFRLPRLRSVVKPSSRCGSCRSAIPAWMNIPLFSYWIAGGRCAKCGYAFSMRYFVVELLTGLFFVALFYHFGISLSALVAAIFVCLMIVASFIDLELKIIPDEISIGGWAGFLILALFGHGLFGMSFLESVLGSLVGYVSFWLLSRGYYLFMGEEGLGGGDVKLMGLIGAALGLKAVLTTILVGSMSGALVSIILLILLRKGRRFPIPFGPFLAFGALVALFQLDFWWEWM